MAAALLAALIYMRLAGTFELPWGSLAIVLAALLLFNAGLLVRLKSARPVGQGEFFANLLLDIVFLTVVLYLSGGSTNPLVSYYLIPLIISAAVLSQGFTWFIAGLTMVCYTVLFYHFVPFDLFALSGHGAMPGAHFWGMWINFAFSALLIAWFVVRMAATMREQDQRVANMRESRMRDEQIISVAGIAAGTAHELRTPLATMTVAIEELSVDHPEMGEELALLQGQVDRCDSILRELVTATTASSEMRTTSVSQFVAGIRDKWLIARPEVPLTLEMHPAAARQEFEHDQSLYHAVLSFLHNAAEASPGHVEMSVLAATDSMVRFRVEDRGAGIPDDVAEGLGKRYKSGKEDGLGLGILLSTASVERLGGKVLLTNRPGGGTRVEIHLPLRS